MLKGTQASAGRTDQRAAPFACPQQSSRERAGLLLSMHLSSRDHGRPAAGRAIAIAWLG
jgi:hypothetical protein